MACPHVSGVMALGISYATQLRKHFKATELQKLLVDSADAAMCSIPIEMMLVEVVAQTRVVEQLLRYGTIDKITIWGICLVSDSSTGFVLLDVLLGTTYQFFTESQHQHVQTVRVGKTLEKLFTSS